MTDIRMEIDVTEDGVHLLPRLNGPVRFERPDLPGEADRGSIVLTGYMTDMDGQQVRVRIPLSREALLELKDPMASRRGGHPSGRSP